MKQIKLIFAGDVMLTRRLPSQYSDDLRKVSELLKQHDYCFGNLETTVHNRDGYPEAFPGGGHAMSAPATLGDLKSFGFNVFNTANNHSMDYSHGGLLETLRNLNAHDLPYAGTGKNLADASVPAYVECRGGIVAMIGVTTSYHDSYMAGPQNQDMQGRPGVNPFRHNTVYELKDEEFRQLQDIANKIGINAYHDQAVRRDICNNQKTSSSEHIISVVARKIDVLPLQTKQTWKGIWLLLEMLRERQMWS